MSRQGSPIIKSCKLTFKKALSGRLKVKSSSSNWSDIETSEFSQSGYEGESDSDFFPPSPRPPPVPRRPRAKKRVVATKSARNRTAAAGRKRAASPPIIGREKRKQRSEVEDLGDSLEVLRKAVVEKTFLPVHLDTLQVGSRAHSPAINFNKFFQSDQEDEPGTGGVKLKDKTDRRKTKILNSTAVEDYEQPSRLSWNISDIENPNSCVSEEELNLFKKQGPSKLVGADQVVFRQPKKRGVIHLQEERMSDEQARGRDETTAERATKYSSFTSNRLKQRKSGHSHDQGETWHAQLSASSTKTAKTEAPTSKAAPVDNPGTAEPATSFQMTDAKATAKAEFGAPAAKIFTKSIVPSKKATVKIPAFSAPKVSAIRTKPSPAKSFPALSAAATEKAALKKPPVALKISAAAKMASGSRESLRRRSKDSARKKTEDDQEVITIDMDETSEDNAAKDDHKLCQFPEADASSETKAVTVSTTDYETLAEGEFLNDAIIDFYLTYLHHEVLNKVDRSCVYVFGTQFYQCITTSSKAEDKELSSEERRYNRVKRWTKNVDLFSKDMVIFPICLEAHWFLIVAVKPGLVKEPRDPEDRITKGEPFLILLDSLGGTKPQAVKIIREYLTREWLAKKGGEESFSARNVKLFKPNKPHQENFTDCGLYLLHYIEKIFGCVAQFYWSKLPDLSDWFPKEEIDRKRFELATHIQNLAKVQNSITVFPDIPLNDGSSPPQRKSKRRQQAVIDDDVFEPEPPVSRRRRDEDPSTVSRRRRGEDPSAGLRRKAAESRVSQRTRKSSEKEKEKEDMTQEFQEKMLLGDEPRLASYKIPKRPKLKLTIRAKDPDLVEDDSSSGSNKDTDERVPNPRAGLETSKVSGLEPSRFYGKPSEDKPLHTRVSEKSEFDSKSDSEGFKNFLRNRVGSRSPKKSDREKFRSFLDDKERSLSSVSSTPSVPSTSTRSVPSTSTRSVPSTSRRHQEPPNKSATINLDPHDESEDAVAINLDPQDESEDGEQSVVIEDDSDVSFETDLDERMDPEPLSSDQCEVVDEDQDQCEVVGEDPDQCEVVGEGPDQCEVVGEVLDLTNSRSSSRDSVRCHTGVSPPFYPSQANSRGKVLVRKGGARTSSSKGAARTSSMKGDERGPEHSSKGVPKVFVEDIDSDVEDVEEGEVKEVEEVSAVLSAVRNIVKNLSPEKPVRKKETVESKINRLSPGAYSSAKYRMYSATSNDASASTTLETSGEYWKQNKGGRGVVMVPRKGSVRASKKRYVLGEPPKSSLNPDPPIRPRCYRFLESSDDWDNIVGSTADDKPIFSE